MIKNFLIKLAIKHLGLLKSPVRHKVTIKRNQDVLLELETDDLRLKRNIPILQKGSRTFTLTIERIIENENQ